MNSLRLTIWMCLSLALTAWATEQPAAETRDLLEQSRALRRQFLSQTQAAVAEKTPDQQDASLSELIEQVLSLQAPVDADAARKIDSRVTGRGVELTAINVEPSDDTAKTQPKDEKALAAEAPDGAAQQDHDMLAALLENNPAPPHPAALADVLYRAGRVDLAGRYYAMALKAVLREDAQSHQWLLFQTANCLRHTDTRQAVALYEELIRLYPNAIWTAAAQARLRTLNWLAAHETDIKLRTETP